MSKQIRVYTAAELKRKNPQAFEKALEHFRSCNDEIPWQGEIIDSLKAVFKHTNGISNLRDWSIDAYGYSYVKFEFDQDEVGDLTGNRALAWLENNLLADLRIKPTMPMFTRFTLPDGSRTEYQPTERGELAKYGQYYRPGMIKPCPFTGVCFDEDYLESLQNSIKAGDTLKEAFAELADVAAKLFRNEIEYQNSEEYFLESESEAQYTVDGRRI